MNHRALFSGIDISRNFLPEEFRYKNWNNHAVRGSLEINENEYLIYGNIGVWKTNSTFSSYADYNKGFKDGIDNKKVYCLAKDSIRIYAGTHFGLFYRSIKNGNWTKIPLRVHDERIESLEFLSDTLFILTRSELITISDFQNFSHEIYLVPTPQGFESKTPLFRFLWELHSGEIFGIAGQIFVDIMGILTIFLTITGIIYFLTPKIIKRNKSKKHKTLKRTNKFSIKWHNKLGIWFVAFLIILVFTGMFLRPPLLITIANSKINNPPLTKFDSPNAWFDKLRDLKYDANLNAYILYTTEGFYYLSKNLDEIYTMNSQVPVSVMGLNVFEKISADEYLIGSFSGLYIWNIYNNRVYDFFTGTHHSAEKLANPFGSRAIQGFIKNSKGTYVFDYASGAIKLFGDEDFIEMPAEIQKSQMSLWNLCLEIHTGRIFHFIVGPFYILYIPLMGISIPTILITGLILWLRKK